MLIFYLSLQLHTSTDGFLAVTLYVTLPSNLARTYSMDTTHNKELHFVRFTVCNTDIHIYIFCKHTKTAICSSITLYKRKIFY